MRPVKGPPIDEVRLGRIERYIREHEGCYARDIVKDTGYSWSQVYRAIFTMTYHVGIWESDSRPAQYGIDDSIVGTLDMFTESHSNKMMKYHGKSMPVSSAGRGVL